MESRLNLCFFADAFLRRQFGGADEILFQFQLAELMKSCSNSRMTAALDIMMFERGILI